MSDAKDGGDCGWMWVVLPVLCLLIVTRSTIGGLAASGSSCYALALVLVLVCVQVDGGLEVVQVELPAVVTADLRLNTPRCDLPIGLGGSG